MKMRERRQDGGTGESAKIIDERAYRERDPRGEARAEREERYERRAAPMRAARRGEL